MASVAVEVATEDDESYRGILLGDPRVGKDFSIYLGGDRKFSVKTVKGWIKPVDGDYTIIFDKNHKQFRVSVIATSDEFI
jgi:hypothetical protein